MLHLVALAIALGSVPPAGTGMLDWPQWLGPQRDGVWRETGIMEKFPPGGPPVRWRAAVGGGYSGPAVADGRVYVLDRQRARGADVKPVRATRSGSPGTERVLCFDARDGRLIWKHEYDCPYKVAFPTGPRTTPTVAGGMAYTLGTMGDLRCLDAATGTLRWARNLVRDYHAQVPYWGFAASALVDGDRLFCVPGGKGSAAVALDRRTGKELWRALDTQDVGYSPPVLVEAGGARQLLVWLSESLNSLDPATGKVYWSQPYPVGVPIERPAVNIITPRPTGGLLFIATYYHGPMLLRLAADRPAARVVWKGRSNNVHKPDGLHSVMCTPVLKDGYLYGVCGFGELRCIRVADNHQMWETMAATTGGKKRDSACAFLVPQGGRFLIFNDHGDLILADPSPKGYREIDRAHVIEPTGEAQGAKVVCCHPAFAGRCMYVRNDTELRCLCLAAEPSGSSAPAFSGR